MEYECMGAMPLAGVVRKATGLSDTAGLRGLLDKVNNDSSGEEYEYMESITGRYRTFFWCYFVGIRLANLASGRD